MTETMGTTATTEPPRAGLPVRVRIAGVVAVLAAVALTTAGLVVYVVESQRIEASVSREIVQELEEFENLQQTGIDPATGRQGFSNVGALLNTFLQRNEPDDDELLVGMAGGEPTVWFPDDDLVRDPEFRRLAAEMETEGGNRRMESRWGELRITSQPVIAGDTRGALIVVAYLDEDKDDLRDTMRTYTVISLILLVLIVLVATWQAGRLLRPLRDLQTTAEELTASDLSQRIPVHGNDDISALTATVNHMLDRLETAFTGQRQFLDDAGHELRTPLTVIGGHLELMDADDPDDVAQTRELVLGEVDRMSRLVRDLILLAKSGRPDFLRLERVDVADLTRGVLAKATALGDRAWTYDEVADVTVVLDEQRVTQALLQLCENSVKHTRPGDTVAVGSSYADGHLLLWVRDTGPGIPAEMREKVFDRFGRAVVPKGDEGFGLGLSIVRAIVLAHGGTVRVDEAEPPGALVAVDLPVALVDTDTDAADAAADTRVDPTTPEET